MTGFDSLFMVKRKYTIIKDRHMDKLHPDDTFLLALLLDANRSNTGWQIFLDAFRNHFNVSSCHLYIANIHTLAPRFQDWSGTKPSDLELTRYMESYFETDYTHLAILRGEPHEWFASNLMPNQEEIESAPAFIEWAIPNNIQYVCGSTLFRKGEWSCVFVSNRSPAQGGYSPEEVNRMRAMSVFIEKAILLRLQIAENKKDTLRLRAVLNHFKLPVAALNEFGEVIAHNQSMGEFLQQQESMALEQNTHFRLLNLTQDKLLQLSISQTISSAKGHPLAYPNEAITIDNGISESFTIGFQELVEQDESSHDIFVGALVFIADSRLISTPYKSQLQTLFSLSDAESQVAYLFSQCFSLKEISIKESKSINTVREQIQNCFKKTNTKNQLELINLIASLPTNSL